MCILKLGGVAVARTAGGSPRLSSTPRFYATAKRCVRFQIGDSYEEGRPSLANGRANCAFTRERASASFPRQVGGVAINCGRARLGRKMPERGRLTGAFSEKTSTERTFASVRTPVLNGRIYVIVKGNTVLSHAGVRIKIFIANSALDGKRSRDRGVRQHSLEGKKNIYICFPIFFRRCTHKRHPLIAGAVN